MNAVEKARQVKVRDIFYTDDDLELAIAWLDNQVTTAQVRAVRTTTNAQFWLGGAVKEAFRRGKLRKA